MSIIIQLVKYLQHKYKILGNLRKREDTSYRM